MLRFGENWSSESWCHAKLFIQNRLEDAVKVLDYGSLGGHFEKLLCMQDMTRR